ncbi:MAG: carboxypeptidase-like regulatory domain-containing protein [Owenweeksia sp.]
MKKFIPIILTLLLAVHVSDLQAQKKKPIQISGIVITADTIGQFIPYANISVKKRKQGTITNAEGFFSFPALPSDTIVFSAVGFKKEKLIIPDTLTQSEYLARVVMRRDTTLLQEVTLYPWPTPERFKDAFLETRVPTTDDDIAMRNLAIQELKARAAEMGYSPEELQDFSIMQREGDIYNYGRYQGYANGGSAILGSLTNPFAWAEFFSALKRGDFSSDR